MVQDGNNEDYGNQTERLEFLMGNARSQMKDR